MVDFRFWRDGLMSMTLCAMTGFCANDRFRCCTADVYMFFTRHVRVSYD